MRPSVILVFALAGCGGTTAGIDLTGQNDGGIGDGAAGNDATTGRDAGGTDGSTLVDSSTGGTCAGPSAVFTMTAKGSFCIGHACQPTWLTILAPDGTELGLDYTCGTDCATCISRPCPPGPCAIPFPVPAGGETTTWNGLYFTNETRTCNGASTTCYQARCAAPGRYTARMCGYARQDEGGPECTTADTATCTDVPFDWPPTASVSGTIGP